MKYLATLLLLVSTTASALCPPAIDRTYEYTGDLRQKITCTFPNQRVDGTPMDWATEGKGVKWYKTVYLDSGYNYEVQLGRLNTGPDCEVWVDLTGNFDIEAVAIDNNDLQSARSNKLQFRYN